MTGDEIVALSKRHTITEWVAQGAIDPVPVARAQGIYFWTPEGKRFIDFNSQLMSVNIGHSDTRVVKAIQDQIAQLAYVTPAMTTEPTLVGRLSRLVPSLTVLTSLSSSAFPPFFSTALPKSHA